MITLRKQLLAATVAAALVGFVSVPASAQSELPPELTQGYVQYMSGGVGTEQVEAMKQVSTAYPLRMEFAERLEGRSVYTAGVNVTIRDRAGRIVLETRTAGPFLFARLPDGNYTVIADAHGEVRTRQVQVDQARPKTLVFEWFA